MAKMKTCNFNLIRKNLFFLIGTIFLASSFAFAEADIPKTSEMPKKGPNFTVDSSDLEPFDLNKKTDPDEKPIFYKDGNTTVGFNDEGEPNVGMRF